jgi:hypothetical protein
MGIAEVLTEPRSRSTCHMKATGWLRGPDVTAGGTGIVSHVGVALVRALSDNVCRLMSQLPQHAPLLRCAVTGGNGPPSQRPR